MGCPPRTTSYSYQTGFDKVEREGTAHYIAASADAVGTSAKAARRRICWTKGFHRATIRCT